MPTFESFHFRTLTRDGKSFLSATDPVMGKREIPLDSALPLIVDQHAYLTLLRERGERTGPDIDDDIAAYETILNAPDPEARATEYKNSQREVRLRPRQVARMKGWMR